MTRPVDGPDVVRIEAAGKNHHGQAVRLETYVLRGGSCEILRALAAECPPTYTWRALPPPSPEENR